MAWCVVVHMSMPFDVLDRNGDLVPAFTELRIPFDSEESAKQALKDDIALIVADLPIRGERWQVVPGEVVRE